MKHIKKTILTVILTALVTVAGTFLYLKPTQTLIDLSDIAIGKPCSPGYPEDTKGLQCYFYGEVDSQTGTRPGIWILPDLRSRYQGSYEDFLSDWKKYETPDGKVEFEYPQVWFINDLNLQSGIVAIGMGQPAEIPPYIMIEEVQKNGVSINDRIADIKRNSSAFLKNSVTLNGSEVIRLDVAPTSNLSNETVYLFIDKGEYYIDVTAPKFNDPLYDFPTEYLLSTLVIR
jgi:hypothetical protein